MPPALQTFNIKLGKFSVLAAIKLPRLDNGLPSWWRQGTAWITGRVRATRELRRILTALMDIGADSVNLDSSLGRRISTPN
jgi:hypothetical protein